MRGDREPAADADPVDRGDRHLRQREQRLKQLPDPVLVGDRVLGEESEISLPAANARRGAAQHEHLHRRVAGQLLAQRAHPGVHLPGEGVVALRAVEGDLDDALRAVDLQLFAHGRSSSVRACAAPIRPTPITPTRRPEASPIALRDG